MYLQLADRKFKDRLRERLMSRVEHNPRTHCLIYTGAWRSEQSGRIFLNCFVEMNVVRVSAWLFKGLNPYSEQIPYLICNNSACINPAHIRIGSLSDASLVWQKRRA